MTPEELAELRDWAAKKMGWIDTPILPVDDNTFYGWQLFWYDGPNQIIAKVKWLPDHPESGQIWMIVERMQELGWYLSLDQSMTKPYEWTAQFFAEVHTHPVGMGTIDEDNPCIAILLAARATEE